MPKGDLDLQAVIFDQDGLMLDTEPAAYRGWRDALAEQGHVLTQEQYGKVVGRSSQSVRRVMMDFYGEDIPIDALIERKNALIEADFDTNGILPKAGIFELLRVVDAIGPPGIERAGSFQPSCLLHIRPQGRAASAAALRCSRICGVSFTSKTLAMISAQPTTK